VGPLPFGPCAIVIFVSLFFRNRAPGLTSSMYCRNLDTDFVRLSGLGDPGVTKEARLRVSGSPQRQHKEKRTSCMTIPP